MPRRARVGLAALLLASALALPAPAGAAIAVTDFSSSGSIYDSIGGVAIGDIDEDGNRDLLYTEAGAKNVLSLLALENGQSAGTATARSVGAGPKGVATGDLNRDGHLDAVTANFGAGTVSVLLGDGTVSLRPATSYTSGGGTSGVALGDVDGDSDLDVVATNATADNLGVLLNSGNGVLSAVTTYSGYDNPGSIVLRDLNDDRRADAIVVAQNDEAVKIAFASVGGGFPAVAATHPAGPGPGQPAVGDFDYDGDTDIVVPSEGDSVLEPFFNNGSGTFSHGTGFSTAVPPVAAAAVDTDGTGRLQIVTANGGSSNNVSVFYVGFNSTALTLRQTVAMEAPTRFIATGDLDNDGYGDWFAAGATNTQPTIQRADLVLQAPVPAFGTVPMGTLSAPKNAVLSNAGNVPGRVINAYAQGTNAEDFIAEIGACGPIPAGGACAVPVRFAPQGSGSRSAVMYFAGGVGVLLSASLSGTGGALPTGPAGATGGVGANGASGATGATGANGATGARGPAGSNSVACKSKGKGKTLTLTCSVKVTVSSTRSKLAWKLLRGRRAVSRGTTRVRAGKATIVIKAARLAKGSYTLQVAGSPAKKIRLR